MAGHDHRAAGDPLVSTAPCRPCPAPGALGWDLPWLRHARRDGCRVAAAGALALLWPPAARAVANASLLTASFCPRWWRCSEGGFFNARLTFPKDYPNSPPTCRFTSEMWHPNGGWAWFRARTRSNGSVPCGAGAHGSSPGPSDGCHTAGMLWAVLGQDPCRPGLWPQRVGVHATRPPWPLNLNLALHRYRAGVTLQ